MIDITVLLTSHFSIFLCLEFLSSGVPQTLPEVVIVFACEVPLRFSRFGADISKKSRPYRRVFHVKQYHNCLAPTLSAFNLYRPARHIYSSALKLLDHRNTPIFKISLLSRTCCFLSCPSATRILARVTSVLHHALNVAPVAHSKHYQDFLGSSTYAVELSRTRDYHDTLDSFQDRQLVERKEAQNTAVAGND